MITVKPTIIFVLWPFCSTHSLPKALILLLPESSETSDHAVINSLFEGGYQLPLVPLAANGQIFVFTTTHLFSAVFNQSVKFNVQFLCDLNVYPSFAFSMPKNMTKKTRSKPQALIFDKFQSLLNFQRNRN